MKKKTQNPVVLTGIMIAVAALIIAGFFILRDRAAKKQENKKSKNEVQKLIEMNLDENYPGNAREVLKIHNRLMKCYYNEELTETEIRKLSAQNYKLFDKELMEKNPYEDYLKRLIKDIANYKTLKITVINTSIQDFSEAEREVKGGYNFCNLLTSYFLKEESARKTVNHKFYLREDDDGKWKILFWEKTEKTFGSRE